MKLVKNFYYACDAFSKQIQYFLLHCCAWLYENFLQHKQFNETMRCSLCHCQLPAEHASNKFNASQDTVGSQKSAWSSGSQLPVISQDLSTELVNRKISSPHHYSGWEGPNILFLWMLFHCYKKLQIYLALDITYHHINSLPRIEHAQIINLTILSFTKLVAWKLFYIVFKRTILMEKTLEIRGSCMHIQ